MFCVYTYCRYYLINNHSLKSDKCKDGWIEYVLFLRKLKQTVTNHIQIDKKYGRDCKIQKLNTKESNKNMIY